jgi:betaine lipid synthase
VPCKQYQLIINDGLKMSTYAARVMDGVAQNSHLRKDNYFYYNCALGRFSRDNCPSYLVRNIAKCLNLNPHDLFRVTQTLD